MLNRMKECDALADLKKGHKTFGNAAYEIVDAGDEMLWKPESQSTNPALIFKG